MNDNFHAIAERLETVLMPLNYHPIFVEAPDKTTRLAWGNDPGEDKLPHGPHSRRIILVHTDTLIIRSPSKLAVKVDGSVFAWRVLLSSQIETFEEVLDLLSVPHLSVLPPHYFTHEVEMLNHKGLCAKKEKHEPHSYTDSTMGPFMCTGDPADREPFRSETRRRKVNV